MLKIFNSQHKQIARIDGYTLRNDKTGRQTEVPYHCSDLKKGLEQAILKQAGLK